MRFAARFIRFDLRAKNVFLVYEPRDDAERGDYERRVKTVGKEKNRRRENADNGDDAPDVRRGAN